MIAELFDRRVRGFRIIEMIALAVLLVLVFTLYLGKTLAWNERTEIAQVERQIAREQERVRLLEAEVAYLESPERLERLSRRYLGMAPIGAEAEARPEQLALLAADGEAAP